LTKILFISGSLGLGHVARDLAIAGELRRTNPGLEILWMAEEPAITHLREMGEPVMPITGVKDGSTDICDAHGGSYQLYLAEVWLDWIKTFPARVALFKDVARREKVDLVIGDETFDIFTEFYRHPELKDFRFVLIQDFLGIHHVKKDPRQVLAGWVFSRWWCNYLRDPRLSEANIFIGELQDIPDEGFGLLLPNKREIARKYLDTVGYILNFNPEDYRDRKGVRDRLGYGSEPLIIATIGGTAVGRPLLEVCASTYPLIKREIPDARMVLVCGPRIPPGSLEVPDGMEVKGFVPGLHEHLAACDLCITAGGATTTLELQALNRPFLYFPLEGHFEQETDVGGRLRRQGVGVEMRFSRTSPESLAAAAIRNIGKKVSYPKPPLDGSRKAAEVINRILAT
jgi:hypothetical protein